jgi:hypothetical protein
VSIIHFKVEDVVQNLKGDIEALIPNYRDVIRTIQKELLEPVVTGTNKEATTQTTQPARFTDSDTPHSQYELDPLRIGQPRRGIGAGFDHNWYACFTVSALRRIDELQLGMSELGRSAR